MLRFGMPTLIEAPSPEEAVQLCHELQLDFVELNMNLPQYQAASFPLQRLKEAAERFGIFYTFHLDENFDPFDFNPYVAGAWLKTLEESLKLAGQLDCPLLNLHLSRGVYFTLPESKTYLFATYREEYLAAVERMKAICDRAHKESGILISMENTGGFLPFQREAIDLLLESPAFTQTYDVGHDYCAGHTDRDFLLARKDKLRHIHLHDASPAGCHLPLGDGLLDIDSLLELAKETGSTVVLETKTLEGLQKSVRRLRGQEP